MNPIPKNAEIVFYVGTHKLAVFAGEFRGEELRIVAHREAFQPEGFENGFVVNLEAAVNSIDSLLSELVPNRGVEDVKASVVLGNSKLEVHSFSSAQYYPLQRTIGARDIRAVIDQTRSVATLPLTQHVLQVVPESFIVNDMTGIRNPLGLEASRLGVNLKIFTMDFQDFSNLSKAFESAEVSVSGYWPRMLTVSEAVLADNEKEEGVILIDVADQITQLIVWKNGRLTKIRNLKNGGKQLSAQIAEDWGIELRDAEKVKERFATLEPETTFGDEIIPLVNRNGRGQHQVRRQEFQQRFNERAKEWMRIILEEVDNLAREENLTYPHYVFSGGGTSFNGFLEFLQHHFNRDARMGLGRHMDAPQEVLVDPSLSAAQGMFRWLSDPWRNYQDMVAPRGIFEKTFVGAREWFYSYF